MLKHNIGQNRMNHYRARGCRGCCFNVQITFTLTVISSILITICSSQVLNTFGRLQDCIVQEERIYSLAKLRIQKLQLELAELKGFVQDFEETTVRHLNSLKTEPDGDDNHVLIRLVASNALLVHLMSHRLVTRLPGIQRFLLDSDKDEEELKEILGGAIYPSNGPEITTTHAPFPSQEDLDNSLASLATLYDTYRPMITPHNFASELSPETNEPVNITAFQATKLALTSLSLDMYGSAVDWVMYAQERVVKQRDDSISSDIVLYTREYMYKAHNDEKRNLSSPLWANFYEKDVNDTMFNDSSTWHYRRDLEIQKYLDRPTNHKKELSYIAACQGMGFRDDVLKRSRLVCYLDYFKGPVFSPLKVEEIQRTPEILLFYNVLSDQDIYEISQQIDKESVKPAFDRGGESGERMPSRGTSAELEVNTAEFPAIAQRINVLLDNGHQEESHCNSAGQRCNPGGDDSWGKLNFKEFVVGRHSHFRQTGSESMKKGRSLLFYLNTVQAGGETVFSTGVSITPIKGAVLYWESPFDSGEDLESMWDADCPVKQGYKRILTLTVPYNVRSSVQWPFHNDVPLSIFYNGEDVKL